MRCCGWSSGVTRGPDESVSGVVDDPMDRFGDSILKTSNCCAAPGWLRPWSGRMRSCVVVKATWGPIGTIGQGSVDWTSAFGVPVREAPSEATPVAAVLGGNGLIRCSG